MAETGDTKRGGRQRKDPAGEPAEEAPAPTEEATAPAAAGGTTAPGPAGPRRRWSVPLVLFVLVLAAAAAGWAWGAVSYRDKEDAEERLAELEGGDAARAAELEARVAELEARVEALEDGRSGAETMLADLRERLDACVEETEALVELFQDALSGDDVDDEALDEQAGRTERVCGEVLAGLDGRSPSSSSTTPTTTLP